MPEFAVDTHCGNVRKLNEDCYEASPEIGLWLVADGVGGHASGDVASDITRRTITEQYRQKGDLVAAVEASHLTVLDAIARREGSANMGSTVVALALQGQAYQIAWVGDSRAYLWNGELVLLTHDHSLVGSLLASGEISHEEAFNHPSRNIITQCIGMSTEATLRVDSVSGTLAEGEQLLLCSDGLNDYMSDQQIAQVFTRGGGVKQQVEQLIDGALQGGGRDNITVAVLTSTVQDAYQVLNPSPQISDDSDHLAKGKGWFWQLRAFGRSLFKS